MDDYKEIRDLLKPRRDIEASGSLREQIREDIRAKGRRKITASWMFGGLGLSAVAAVLILLLLPPGVSAKAILVDAINLLRNTQNISMVVEVRTRPMENFRYIDINEGFVRHNISVLKSDSLTSWRIDKGERIAVSNGTDIYSWIPSLNLGLHINRADDADVLGYMATLLNPREILESELEYCVNARDAKFNAEKKGNDIILTVHASPQGDFVNSYLLNISIAESESVRRYVIDADSKELKSATVSVVNGSREIVVLKLSSINYGQQADDICKLPDGIKFVDTDTHPLGLKGLSAEEAASAVLNAFADWNKSILDSTMMHEFSEAAYKEHFAGSRLIYVGQPFTSGSGHSVFVPYALELRDGTTQRHNLALQKTESGGWIVVGGL